MNNKNRKIQRQVRGRAKLAHISDRPRLSVFRSNNYIYAQIIDVKGDTIVGTSDKAIQAKGTPIEKAKLVGTKIAELATAKKIKEVSFDKGRFAFHGRVKSLADGAREGGLQF